MCHYNVMFKYLNLGFFQNKYMYMWLYAIKAIKYSKYFCHPMNISPDPPLASSWFTWSYSMFESSVCCDDIILLYTWTSISHSAHRLWFLLALTFPDNFLSATAEAHFSGRAATLNLPCSPLSDIVSTRGGPLWGLTTPCGVCRTRRLLM